MWIFFIVVSIVFKYLKEYVLLVIILNNKLWLFVNLYNGYFSLGNVFLFSESRNKIVVLI